MLWKPRPKNGESSGMATHNVGNQYALFGDCTDPSPKARVFFRGAPSSAFPTIRPRLNAEKRAIVMPATETVGMNLYGSNRDGYAIARSLDAQRMSSQPI